MDLYNGSFVLSINPHSHRLFPKNTQSNNITLEELVNELLLKNRNGLNLQENVF